MAAPNKEIKVMIVDDHSLFREGLISLIEREKDITVVGESESAEGCVAAFEEAIGVEFVRSEIDPQIM